MSRRMVPSLVLALLVTLAVGFAPAKAHADAGQIYRALSTIALAPTDVILAPYIVYGDMMIGYTDYSDHWLAITTGTLLLRYSLAI